MASKNKIVPIKMDKDLATMVQKLSQADFELVMQKGILKLQTEAEERKAKQATTQEVTGAARFFPEGPKEPSLLARADAIINGARLQEYGNTLQNFSQISMLWQATLATKILPDAKISPEDVALCMMQVKIARLAKTSNHKDSILDVAGYAGCFDKLQEERLQCVPLLGATQDYRP